MILFCRLLFVMSVIWFWLWLSLWLVIVFIWGFFGRFRLICWCCVSIRFWLWLFIVRLLRKLFMNWIWVKRLLLFIVFRLWIVLVCVMWLGWFCGLLRIIWWNGRFEFFFCSCCSCFFLIFLCNFLCFVSFCFCYLVC